MKFLGDIPKIISVLSVINELPEAIKELENVEKRQEAINYFKDEFDIDNDKAEALIEAIIQNLSEILSGVTSIINAIKSFKE
jgi:predicted PurR-regulated permease PerM